MAIIGIYSFLICVNTSLKVFLFFCLKFENMKRRIGGVDFTVYLFFQTSNTKVFPLRQRVEKLEKTRKMAEIEKKDLIFLLNIFIGLANVHLDVESN